MNPPVVFRPFDMDETERLAAKLHELFCGCAASEDEAGTYQWCDSIWLVAADRVRPILRECIENLCAIVGEHS